MKLVNKSYSATNTCLLLKMVKVSLPKIKHTVCQLSGVSIRFQVYGLCLHVAHRNTRVKGENFVINCHQTHVNTLKSLKRAYTALVMVKVTSHTRVSRSFEYKKGVQSWYLRKLIRLLNELCTNLILMCDQRLNNSPYVSALS